MHQKKTPAPSNITPGRLAQLFLLAAALLFFAALPASSAPGQSVGGNTPRFVSSSKVISHEEPTQVMEVSLWLQPRNRAEMDSLARELYDPTSSQFRKWLKQADIAAKFAPTADDVRTVQTFLVSKGLKIVSVGPQNFFIRASGTAGAIEAAFHVHLNNYQVGTQTIRANDVDPSIEGAAAAIVRHVSGLDNAAFTHPYAARPTLGTASKTGPASGVVSAVDGASAATAFFVSECFTGTKTEKYTTVGASYPTAHYSGNNYYGSETGPGCGYTPAEIRTAYNLNGLYKEGFDGTGQTIVILDWCGSPTIQNDANVFSAKFGLPKLTSANFKIIETPTISTCGAPDPEINIDVEWAHAIAPGASIDLVVPPSASFQDVNQAEFYAVNYDLGNVLSGSYGSDEAFTSTAELDTESLISEIGAISGISTNFATGDEGDYSFGGFDPTSVSAPADSPYATAVGGVTLALNSSNGIAWQTGWGNNVSLLLASGEIFDPPLFFGFNGGSGGGASGYFFKPSYQDSLPGTSRLLPDISWLADPFTGGIIAITEPNQFPPVIYTVYGGTSLATPMFSGLWAIANQEAAAAGPLGQAAPYLYTMPKGTITDILPYRNLTNVNGTVVEGPGESTFYHSYEIAGVPSGTPFYSAFWDYPYADFTTYVISFGTDSSLTITPGWDNVTGLGTPNGKAFADFFFVPPPPATPATK
jgi:subtilase family serine protease